MPTPPYIAPKSIRAATYFSANGRRTGPRPVLDPRLIWLLREPRKGCMSEGPGLFRDNEDGLGVLDLTRFSGHITVTQRGVQNVEARQEIYTGVPVPDGTAGTSWARDS